MPAIEPLTGINDSPPQNVPLTQDKFDRGVISLVDQSKLPKNALKEADNIVLSEDGAPKVRPGLAWYGTSALPGGVLDGGSAFIDNDEAETSHLVQVIGGKVYRSINDGVTWAECTGASFTSGKKVRTIQANDVSYLYNGWDNIIRYNGDTLLDTYVALPTPTGNAPTKTGLGGATIYTYRYRVAAVNNIGYTLASPATTIGVDRTRTSFDSTNFVTFTWLPVTGAVRYDIYVGLTSGEEAYIGSVEGQATTTYQDRTGAVEQVANIVPDSNTTQGPRVGDMAVIGTRIYATADRDFPYRVWISGAGRYMGMFSSAYDATYIDLQKGGLFKPVKVEDYRDGKGTPLATVWCRSKDGKGCVWQGSLESFTVGTVTFPVPNFYKLPGSRGTEAPMSVINVLNDYFYYNSQAFYNLGSRAQFMNLLSTDEASANIRPDVKKIRASAADGIVAHFEDAKLYFSVPYNSDQNNATIMYDTERRAWLPRAFNVGFERFFSYTDVTGTRHTLAWKPGDDKFTEISERFKGDYGQKFYSSLMTGLMHVNPRNRMEFMWIEEAEFEFANPEGEITVELSGITRNDGFRQIASRTMKPDGVLYSWSTHQWTRNKWTDTAQPISSYSEPSRKRYFSVQEDLNAYQYRVTTNSLASNYVLRTLQVNGTATQAGKPREWELYE